MIIRRLIAGALVVFTVATISFFLLRQAPGGPFDAERSLLPEVQRNIEERYHLNDPLWKQYVTYIDELAHGDLGHSLKRPQTVNELIATHYSYSLILGGMAIVVAALLGIVMGVLAAAKRNTWIDHGLMTLALIGVSIPSIVLAPMFIGWFALRLGWFPAARADSLRSFILPSLSLGLIYVGTVARLARTGMIETLSQDFIRTARAKGLSERTIIWKHALRLGVLPVVTYLGPAVAALISGSFVVEQIFQIPGLGFYFVASVTDRDYPVLAGMLVFYVTLLVILNLIVDITLGILDPRIRAAR